MVNNLYKTYKQQSVMTMTSGDLLIALYDGLLKELSQAQNSFKQNNYADINRDLKRFSSCWVTSKAPSISITRFPITSALYDYFIDVVKKANLKGPDGARRGNADDCGLRDAFIRPTGRRGRLRQTVELTQQE